VLAVVESNTAGNGYACLQAANSLGYSAVFLTENPGFFDGLKCNPLDLETPHRIVNTRCVESLLRAFVEENVQSVATFDDFHVVPVAATAMAMGLVGPSPLAVMNCRYKDRMRQVIGGLPAGCAAVRLRQDTASAVSGLSYPLVLKPIDGSGGVGVVHCDDVADVQDALLEHGQHSSERPTPSPLIAEPAIRGTQYSAELFWDAEAGDFICAGFCKKTVAPGRYPVELGHVFPHQFAEPTNQAVESAVRGWARASGLSSCVAHVEFVVTCHGEPFLIEINPRLGGGHIPILAREANGIDMFRACLCVASGEPVEDLLRPRFHLSAAIRFVLPKPGHVRAVRWAAQESEGVHARENIRVPRTIRAVRNNDDRVGYIITVATDSRVAEKNAEACVVAAQVAYQ